MVDLLPEIAGNHPAFPARNSLDKLRFLLYPNDLTEADEGWIRHHMEGVKWLDKTKKKRKRRSPKWRNNGDWNDAVTSLARWLQQAIHAQGMMKEAIAKSHSQVGRLYHQSGGRQHGRRFSDRALLRFQISAGLKQNLGGVDIRFVVSAVQGSERPFLSFRSLY